MAREIEITQDDLNAMTEKLQNERASMAPEEIALIEALVAKAAAERGARPTSEPGWYFRWTYRF